jgi:hypothetical protein
MNPRRLKAAIAAAAALMLVTLAAPGVAHAQEGPGVQVGVSTDPGQFYLGAHYVTAPIVEHVWFRPNLEVGVGHDLTLVALNFDFIDRMPLRNTDWQLYFGGGPALNIRRFDQRSESGGGLNLLVGLQHPHGLFTEVKIGLADSPSFKFGIGYTFGR